MSKQHDTKQPHKAIVILNALQNIFQKDKISYKNS